MIKFKHITKIFFLILCVFSSQGILGQKDREYSKPRQAMEVPVNKEGLKELRLMLKEEQAKQEILKTKFDPIKYTDDSTKLHLDRVDPAGNPVYLKTFKVQNAAKVMNLDKVYSDNTIPAVDGSGVLVGVWDETVARRTHHELVGKVENKDASPETSNHSTHVVGTIASVGLRSQLKGIAPGAEMWSYNWSNAFSELTAAADSGMLISNHSYGTNVTNSNKYMFGKYDNYAYYYDNITYNAPHLLPIKAAGNDQSAGYNTGDLGYDLLTDGAVAKNVLCIGGLKYSFSHLTLASATMSTYSSWGPTDDYRLKPDVCAPGYFSSTFAKNDSSYGYSGGTSMASPIAAGVATLLQDLHIREHGAPMLASTVKAIILNTAEDKGNPGPDFQYGWGAINAQEAVRVMKSEERFAQILEDTLTNGMVDTVSFYYDGVDPLRITMAWTDPAHNLDYSNYIVEDSYDKALVNDLDMVLVSSTNSYYPYTFDSSLSYTQVAQNGVNSRDNVEGIIPGNIPVGEYNLVISHKGNLTNGSQAYSLVIDGQDNPLCPSIRNAHVDTMNDGKLKLVWHKMLSNEKTDITYTSTITNESHHVLLTTDTTFILADADYDDNLDVSIEEYRNISGSMDSSHMITMNVQTPSKPCSPIPFLNGSNITTESVDLNWSTVLYDPNTMFELEYKKYSDASWTDMSNVYPDENTVLGGLQSGEQYDVRIRESCDANLGFTFYSFSTQSSFGSSLGIDEVNISATHDNGTNYIQVEKNEDIQSVEIFKLVNHDFDLKSTMNAGDVYEDSQIHGNESVYKVAIHTEEKTLSKVVTILHDDAADDEYDATIHNNILHLDVHEDHEVLVEVFNSLGQKLGLHRISNTRIAEIDLSKYPSLISLISISIDGEHFKTIEHMHE